MDLKQQQLLARILQQSDLKFLDLKGYQTTLDVHQQLLDPKTTGNKLGFGLFPMQRNETAYPNLMQNLNSSICPTSTYSRNQIFSGFSSVMSTNYLPIVPCTTRPLNVPFVDEMTSFLVADELQKKAYSTKQTWQNLMQQQEMRLAQLKTQHELHEQVPSVSRFMKRRTSESVQQQEEKAEECLQTTVIKRAKVVVIEQKDMQPTPCCSSSF